MSVPSVVGLPQECDYSGGAGVQLPPAARSWAASIAPSNLSSIVSATQSVGTLTTAQSPVDNLSMNATTAYIDLPCGGGDSIFLDPRFTTLSFTAKMEIVTAGSAAQSTSSYQRGSGASWFDRMYITSSNGQILEDISEFGLLYDTLTKLMMNNSTMDAVGLAYGCESDDLRINIGHKWNVLSRGATNLAAGEGETHSYEFPLISGVLGTHASRFLNIGRLSKLQLALTTTSVLPITITTSTSTSNATFKVTLENIRLNLQLIDVGADALRMIDSGLIDGKMYMTSVTHRVSASAVPAQSGTNSITANIRCSSLKALITRFYEGGTASTTNSYHGKYDSKCPAGLDRYAYVIGGTQYPSQNINPLLQPAKAFAELQKAVGGWNNYAYQSSIPTISYCRMAVGGASQGYSAFNNQDWNWALGASSTSLCSFFIGQNLEVISKKSILSGLNVGSSNVFFNYNLSATPTNACIAYTFGVCDVILIHDVNMRTLDVRI